MIVISGIIGSGIFINPYVVARTVQTPLLILAVWVAGGVIALFGAFVFAELSTVMPRVGGQYAFFREAFHPMVAFLHGWALLLIVQSGATAAVAVAFAQYVARLVGPAAGSGRAGSPSPSSWASRASTPWASSPGAVLINVITFAKTLALAALIVGAFVLTRELRHHVRAAGAAGPRRPAAALGLLRRAGAGHVRLRRLAEPQLRRRGGARPAAQPAAGHPDRRLLRDRRLRVAPTSPMSTCCRRRTWRPRRRRPRTWRSGWWGRRGRRLVSLLIVVSTFGFLNLSLMAAPRVYYAMAADGLFFRSLARLSPRFRAPTAAILLQGALAAASP